MYEGNFVNNKPIGKGVLNGMILSLPVCVVKLKADVTALNQMVDDRPMNMISSDVNNTYYLDLSKGYTCWKYHDDL